MVAGAPRAARLFSLAQLALPGLAEAHSFGRLYTLPVPFWMYVYGASAALALSFVLIAWFAVAPQAARPADAHETPLPATRRRWPLVALKSISLLGLALCLLTGFFGNPDPYANFSMTFFWIMFVLAFTYLTAVIGDLYGLINPWQTLARLLERALRGYARGRLRYPQALGYWPALAFYMAFIWIELFAQTRPFSLAAILAAYSLINLIGVWLIGQAAWFRYCEFFAVFLRLIAKMAPLDPGGGRLRWRAPFSGLLEDRAENYGLLLFILFMLSSTAYDGLRETVAWYQFFWSDPLGIIKPWVGHDPLLAYPRMRMAYAAWDTLALLLSPFLYLAVYLAFIGLARLAARSRLPLRELALKFGFSLLPIALVYNITHYFTLVLTQGPAMVRLLSDPYGRGWNLFGTAGLPGKPFFPDMAWVWHTQVGLILLGHIVSVYLAHVVALRTFSTRAQATYSQLPMLTLMMVFTTAGLWILAQPLKAGM